MPKTIYREVLSPICNCFNISNCFSIFALGKCISAIMRSRGSRCKPQSGNKRGKKVQNPRGTEVDSTLSGADDRT